jgi:hypothetical protein
MRMLRRIHRPVVLFECEIWRSTLREKHRLRVSENEVLTRISGPKTNKLTDGWRNLYNEKIGKLYSSSNIMRTIKSKEMGGTWSTQGGIS